LLLLFLLVLLKQQLLLMLRLECDLISFDCTLAQGDALQMPLLHCMYARRMLAGCSC